MSILSDIENSICDLEDLLGASVTIIDREGVFHDSVGKPLFPVKRQTHQKNRICALGFCNRCIQHCRYEMNAKGAKLGKYFFSYCWKGAMEVVVPIIREDVHMGNFFIGIWRAPERTVPENSSHLPVEALNEYTSLPPFDEAFGRKIGNVASLFVSGIVRGLEEVRLISQSKGDRKGSIRNYLYKNASSAASLDALAKDLNLSASRASHLVKELFGCSFQELLLQERMNRAKNLLLSTSDPVKDIAARVGISDEYHFNRTFKKYAGLPPGKFRRAQR